MQLPDPVYARDTVYRLEALGTASLMGPIVRYCGCRRQRPSQLWRHSVTVMRHLEQIHHPEQVLWASQPVLHVHCQVTEIQELEITESLLIEDHDKTFETLDELREIGVKLAIDDFGTGYSSMGHLKRLSIDTIKIDRSFVKDIPGDDDAATIVMAIILMAHSLRKQVVAEGVETQAQVEFLRARHCEFAQGFLFSKPLPVREFSQYLRTRLKVIKMATGRRRDIADTA